MVAVARRAGLPVLVVDDGSTDGTADVAEAAGASVLRAPHGGKGAAMAAGAALSTADVVVFLDADLTGLQPGHLAALAEPVVAGTADVTVGQVDHQTEAGALALSGQRAMRRMDALRTPGLQRAGYGAEGAMAAHARAAGARVVVVRLEGVFHRTKAQKWGLAGLVAEGRTQADFALQSGVLLPATVLMGGAALVVAVAEASGRRR